MELPGIYVVVKGDYTELQRNIKAAQALVKGSAIEISNALNNALAPEKIRNNINSLVAQFGTLNRASSVVGQAFDGLGVDLGELRKITGLSEDQFSALQSRLLRTQAANAQEVALKKLAIQLRLTESEVKNLGAQFGLLPSQVERINKSVGNIGEAGKKKMDIFSGSIAMAAGKFLLLEQAAYSVQRILNAMVFDFNATVETATIGISAAFLNNGQYVDQITGKVLTGQQAMKAAMQDADGVIQQLRASNMVTIATLDQLIKAYQEAAPVALSKGFNKDQIEQFTIAMMQAAGAVDTTGMLIGQMGEEMRALLNGGINPKNTRIATALGITNEDVARYKGDVQGLFNFLMSKLAAYQAFGDQLQKTWRGVASNTADIFKQVSAQATEPLFVAVRDGLYEWQQGIAKVVVKTDELGNVTRTLEWNPEYLRSVEKVKETIDGLIGTVRANKDVIGAMFDAAGSAALQSLDGINQVLILLGNVVTTAKQGVAEIKALAGVKVDLPVPTDIPGAMLNGLRKANMEWTKINDEWSGKRDEAGNLTSGTAQEVAIDRIQQRVKALKQELSVAENSITSLVFGDRSPEQIKADLAGAESQLKSLTARAKDATGTVAVYQPNQNAAVSEEWTKGREKFLASLQTEREKALAEYEEQKQYVETIEEGQKLRAQLSEKLASIDAKEAKANQAAGLKAERSALKELNVEITGYTAEARAAADAAMDWHRSAENALDGIARLNAEVSTSGMGEFGRMAFDASQLIKEGTKEIEAYQIALAQADSQISTTAAQYDLANARLNDAKKALAANSAGSSADDANKVRALEKEVEELSLALKAQTADYYNLAVAQKGAIKTVEELRVAIADQQAFDAALSAYQQLGVVSRETFSRVEDYERAERDKFIQMTGDKDTAARLFYEKMLEYRKALAANEYEQTGDVSGLMKTGLEKYNIEINRDAISFYTDLLPDAIGDSSSALAQFARDVAQGNATLSESWEALGQTIEDVVFDILQDLTQMYLKMAIMGIGQSMFGSLFGGVTGSTSGGTGNYGVGVTGGARHAGGTIGVDDPTFTRMLPASAWDGAPRYHTGLMSDEFTAILQRGESVLTEGQMKAIGKGLSVNAGGSKAPVVNHTVIEAPGVKAETQTTTNDDGSLSIVVKMVETQLMERASRGKGLHVLMRQYGTRRGV